MESGTIFIYLTFNQSFELDNCNVNDDIKFTVWDENMLSNDFVSTPKIVTINRSDKRSSRHPRSA